jgi:hypothetical protein
MERIGSLGGQLDPLGDDVGQEDPYLPDRGADPGFNYPHMGDMSDPSSGCTVDGQPWNCTQLFKVFNAHIVSRVERGPFSGQGSGFDPWLNGSLRWIDDWRPKHVDHPADDPDEAVLRVYTDIYNGHWEWIPDSESDDGGQKFHHARRRRRSQPKAKPVDSRSACDKFAEELASRLYKSVVLLGGYNSEARHDLANEMRNQAIDDVDLNGNRYNKRSYPIDGFKTALINNNQLADVYHHILFTAGNALHGTIGGDAENAAFKFWDGWQKNVQGRAESQAELHDDNAGWDVGTSMLNTALAGQSGDYWALKAQIKNILCDH